MARNRTPPPCVDVTRRKDGTLVLHSPLPLARTHQSLPHIFDETANIYPGRIFMRQRITPGGPWRQISYGEAAQASRAFAQWLLDQETKPGEALAILSGPSIEHAIVAIAAQRIHVAVAPLSVGYSLLSKDHAKLKRCVERSGARIAFVEDAAVYENAMRALMPLGIRFIAAFGREKDIEYVTLEQLLKTIPTTAIDRAMAAITPDTIARIMYTSGSTGSPKATPQTQANLTITVAQTESLGLLDFDGQAPQLLEAMPFSHIMAGNFNFNNVIRAGGTINIDEGKPVPQLFHHTIANLREVSPHLFITVPLGYAMLCDAMEADATLRDCFFKNMVYMGFGGAVLSDSVMERLAVLARRSRGGEVPMYSFYGATEYLFGALKYWPSSRMDIIGLPLPDTDLKLVPDGDKYELRVKGRTLMPQSGYLGDSQSSDALFDEEGFFKTGDAVRFADPEVPENGLVFAGRLAEDFKLSSGTYVTVNTLRLDLLAACEPYLREAVICGLNQSWVGALLWLNDTATRAILGKEADTLSSAQLAQDPRVVLAVRNLIFAFNAKNSGSACRIKRFIIMTEPLSYDANEITDKGTASQRVVRERRADEIKKLFGDNEDGDVVSL